jgi:16S rRNA (guanine966-N2)-methyltransferase
LRIISGKYKSRKLFVPGTQTHGNKAEIGLSRTKKDYIRPTSDRAKETLFDILSNRIDFSGKKCLDLFAGTGALGFECLSRGSELCDFVDSSALSVRTIQKNTNVLNCNDNVRIFQQEAFQFLKEHTGEKYDLIFSDPPYSFNKYREFIELVLNISFSIFVIEHDSKFKQDINLKGFDKIVRPVGKTSLTIFTI